MRNVVKVFYICIASVALIGVAEAQKGGGKVKYAVSVTVNGSGTVVSNTGGISCPGTCSTTVNSGTNVSLTAVPDSGANFLGWDGDCAIYGSDPVCTLTISADTNATANFDNGNNPPTPYSPVVIDVACDGTGTKLQDALNALNPVANVYEVRVSGVCPEPLTIAKFISLKISSSNASARANIGPLYIHYGVQFIDIRGLDITNPGTAQSSYALVARNSRTIIDNVHINCTSTSIFPTEKCLGLTFSAGNHAVYMVSMGGENWGTNGRRVVAGANSSVGIYNYALGRTVEDYSACQDINYLWAAEGGALSFYQGIGCQTTAVQVQDRASATVLLESGSGVTAILRDWAKLVVMDLHDLQFGDGSNARPYDDMVLSTSCGRWSVAYSEHQTNKCPP